MHHMNMRNVFHGHSDVKGELLMSIYVASIKFGDLPWWSGKITRVPVALIVNAVSSVWNEDLVC